MEPLDPLRISSTWQRLPPLHSGRTSYGLRPAGAVPGATTLTVPATRRSSPSFPAMVKNRGVAACVLAFLLGLGSPSWAEDRNAGPPKMVDCILIAKSARTLTLMRDGKVLKTYLVALGTEPVGPKVQEGDNKTPEGKYVIDSKNAHSRF